LRKILIVSNTLDAGGAERVAVNLGKELTRKGYNVFIITSKNLDRAFYDIQGLNVFYNGYKYDEKSLSKKVVMKYKRLKHLRKFVRANQIDLVISFKWEVALTSSLALIGIKVKHVFSEHNNYYALKSLVLRVLRNIFYRIFPKKITILTDRDVDSYPKMLSKKLVVVPNALGIEVSEKQPYNQYSTRLIAVGRLTEQKGFDRLITLVPALLDEVSDLTLEIYGDGPLREVLESRITSLKLEDTVFLKGISKDMSSVYSGSRALLMTSRWEGLPMVIGEAMNHSVPVIAYDCPTGPREFIDHSVNGLLIEDGNHELFVKETANFLRDNGLSLRLSNAAYEASLEMTSSKITKIWEGIIRDN